MMKPALAFRQPKSPEQWQELPNGDYIKQVLSAELETWWPKFFGYHLLKIGALSGCIATESSTIKHQVKLAPSSKSTDVIADIDDLPLLEHSVDVCLLAHALEFTVDPHHVVREADRVLIPNGYLVITGYNPFSFAGLNKLIPFRRQQLPWNERFFSPLRVKDWLHLMGYEILSDSRHIHSMLAKTSNPGVVGQTWQQLCDNFFSRLGSIYIIVAKKRQHPLTPIKPKWRIRPKFQPVKVSPMNSSNKINQ